MAPGRCCGRGTRSRQETETELETVVEAKLEVNKEVGNMGDWHIATHFDTQVHPALDVALVNERSREALGSTAETEAAPPQRKRFVTVG